MSAPSELVSELFHASQRACRLNCNEGMREKIYGGKINFFFSLSFLIMLQIKHPSIADTCQ